MRESHNRMPDPNLNTTGASTSFRQTTFPFGTTISAETTGNSNQVFTSYDRSSTTGLDYAQNRTYSKGQSRFTQVDPIQMASASLGNPQSNNLYAYTQNMPTDFVDPSGLNISNGGTCYLIINGIHYKNGKGDILYTIITSQQVVCVGGSGNSGQYQFHGGGGRNLGSTRAGYNKRLSKGNCREKLNQLLKALGVDNTIDSLANQFFDGTNKKKLLFETPKRGVASYNDNIIRIGPRNIGEPSGMSEEANSFNFIHELLHAAGGSGLGFSHRDIVKKMYGDAFDGILDQIDTDAKAKKLKGSAKDEYKDGKLSDKMNAWIKENCPL